MALKQQIFSWDTSDYETAKELIQAAFGHFDKTGILVCTIWLKKNLPESPYNVCCT